MFIVNYYIINPQMVYMRGEFDRYGKLCAIVLEEAQTFIVDKSPLEVVKDSIIYMGLDFNGALAGSKNIIGKRRMCPVMVNHIRGICIFPDRAYKSSDCLWINSYHIAKTDSFYRKTKVEFSNGSSIILQTRLSAFNTKLQNAEQLRKMSYERGMNSTMMVLDPKKKQTIRRRN